MFPIQTYSYSTEIFQHDTTLHIQSKLNLLGPNQTLLFFVLMNVKIHFLRSALLEFTLPFMEGFVFPVVSYYIKLPNNCTEWVQYFLLNSDS
jgi:hypothetical protein